MSAGSRPGGSSRSGERWDEARRPPLSSRCRPAPDWRNDVQVPAAFSRRGRPRRSDHAQMIRPDEEIIAGNQGFGVLDVVPFEEEGESPFVGLLRVEDGP